MSKQTKKSERKPRNTRQYQPRKKPQITALALKDVNKTQEKEEESSRDTPWYNFFVDSKNIYINDLAKRAKRSPTHGAILQSKATYTAGQGFTYFNAGEQLNEGDLDTNFLEYIQEVNSNRQSLHWMYGKNAYDYIYSGNAYIEVVRGTEFTSLFYLDASKVRINKTTAFISSWWHEILDDVSKKHKDYPIEEVELWDGNLETTQQRFVIHMKNDTPEYDYYGLPEHIQVLKWADVEYKIAQFNLMKLKNGFFPSAAITVVGTPPEGMTHQQYVDEIKKNFTDEENNSKMIVQMVDSPDQAIQINEFTGASEGEMLQLQTTSRDMIIAGHRWYPSLAGISTAGQLGSNQQIRNEYNIALKGVVIPQYQNPLNKVYNDLLKMLGFDVTIGILNVAPVGIEDMLDPKAVLTEDEQRELLGFAPMTDEQKGDEETEEEVETEEEAPEETEE